VTKNPKQPDAEEPGPNPYEAFDQARSDLHMWVTDLDALRVLKDAEPFKTAYAAALAKAEKAAKAYTEALTKAPADV